jgi:hypothetical protein
MATSRRRAVLTGLLMCAMSGSLSLGASSASADPAPQFCTLDLSTGSYTCTGSQTQARLAGQVADAGTQTILGRFFDDPDKSGANGWFQVTATSGCDSSLDLDWALNVMPSGWNDRISSFQAYANCDVRLFSNGFLTGSVYGPSTSANSLGSMDNQTSSIGFY